MPGNRTSPTRRKSARVKRTCSINSPKRAVMTSSRTHTRNNTIYCVSCKQILTNQSSYAKHCQTKKHQENTKVTNMKHQIKEYKRELVKLRKPTRPKMPKSRRDQNWIAHNGTSGYGFCRICGNIITYETHECAHINSFANGGSHELKNLTTTCMPCNRRYGRRDMPNTLKKENNIIYKCKQPYEKINPTFGRFVRNLVKNK